jgi:hypothetical protein
MQSNCLPPINSPLRDTELRCAFGEDWRIEARLRHHRRIARFGGSSGLQVPSRVQAEHARRVCEIERREHHVAGLHGEEAHGS